MAAIPFRQTSMTDLNTKKATELRVNFGSEDWRVDLTVDQFEELLNDTNNLFIILPLLFAGKPHSTLRVRPQQIRYYYEVLPAPNPS